MPGAKSKYIEYKLASDLSNEIDDNAEKIFDTINGTYKIVDHTLYKIGIDTPEELTIESTVLSDMFSISSFYMLGKTCFGGTSSTDNIISAIEYAHTETTGHNNDYIVGSTVYAHDTELNASYIVKSDVLNTNQTWLVDADYHPIYAIQFGANLYLSPINYNDFQYHNLYRIDHNNVLISNPQDELSVYNSMRNSLYTLDNLIELGYAKFNIIC